MVKTSAGFPKTAIPGRALKLMKTRLTIGWRDGAAGALLVAGLIGSIIGYRYVHRPLFANHFSDSELDPLPAWRMMSLATRDGDDFLSDWRPNIILIARKWGDGQGHNHIIITDEPGGVAIRLNQCELRIPPAQKNMLFIMSESSIDRYPIGPGDAKALYDDYWQGPDAFDAALSRLTNSTQGSLK